MPATRRAPKTRKNVAADLRVVAECLTHALACMHGAQSAPDLTAYERDSVTRSVDMLRTLRQRCSEMAKELTNEGD